MKHHAWLMMVRGTPELDDNSAELKDSCNRDWRGRFAGDGDRWRQPRRDIPLVKIIFHARAAKAPRGKTFLPVIALCLRPRQAHRFGTNRTQSGPRSPEATRA